MLHEIGLSSDEIKKFKKDIESKGKVFIPEINLLENGKRRIFSLLSTKTDNQNFGYLNGIQGQLVDRTLEITAEN